jgi:hypothetical protein
MQTYLVRHKRIVPLAVLFVRFAATAVRIGRTGISADRITKAAKDTGKIGKTAPKFELGPLSGIRMVDAVIGTKNALDILNQKKYLAL